MEIRGKGGFQVKVELSRVDDISDEGANTVDFFGREVLLYKDEVRPKAVFNVCMHLAGPMQFEGNRFVCQWRGGRLQTGQANRRTCPPGRSADHPAYLD